MDKKTIAKLKTIKREQKNIFAEKSQTMIHELMIEGWSIGMIADEVGATRMSVNSWKIGNPPSRANFEIVARVHKQVMFLKERGIKYSEIKKFKTLEDAYIEKKGEEIAA